jgi:Fimbrial assembly protein (PilN)
VQVLNFVPRDYIQKKLARKANLLCALLVAAVGLALAVLVVALGVAEDALGDDEAVVEAKVQQAAKQVASWKAFRLQRSGLLDKADKAARLMVPLPRSRILAEVVRAVPEGTALLELSILNDVVRVVAASKGKPRRSRGRTAAAQVKEFAVTKLRIVGLAPRDIEVALLIAALSNSPYFDEVELPLSEDHAMPAAVLRRFEIQCVLSDAAYHLAFPDGDKEALR